MDVTQSTDSRIARLSSQGTLELAGSDERERYEARVEGELVETTEYISVGSEEWKRTDGGPWIASDPTDDQPFLTKLNRIEGFRSLGREKMGGRDLHHLRLAKGLTPDLRDWGPTDAGYSNIEVDLDFWVDDDGTPVVMEMRATFTFAEGGEKLEFERHSTKSFEAVGGQLTIEAPDEVWQTFRSDALGYTIGYPAGVVVASADGVDNFTFNDSVFLSISAQDAPAGLSLDAWREDLVASLVADRGAEFQDAKPARIGGREAQLLALQVKDAGGSERLVLEVIVINNGRAFEITAVSDMETEAETRAGLATVLTTFEFAD